MDRWGKKIPTCSNSALVGTFYKKINMMVHIAKCYGRSFFYESVCIGPLVKLGYLKVAQNYIFPGNLHTYDIT